MYKHCLFDKSQECKDKYERYKNRLTCILRRAEKEYYASKLLEMKDNAARTWKILNEMTNGNRKSKNISVTSLKINNVLIDNPQVLANSFITFSQTLGLNWPNKLPQALAILSITWKEISCNRSIFPRLR